MTNLDWIIETFGQERINKSKEFSNELLCRDVMESFNAKVLGKVNDKKMEELTNAIEAIELSIIESLKNNEPEKIKQYSLMAFQFYRVIELPENSTKRLKQMIKTSCFGIMGERTADVSRWLKDNDFPKFPDTDLNWANEVFYQTGIAFLLNVRKDGWNDLEQANELIEKLRKNQKTFEENYLKNVTDQPQIAALELISLYHLVKAIDILSIFFRNGNKPRKVLEDINFHLDKAFEAVVKSGIAELGLLITWMRNSIQSMVKNSVWWILTAINHNITKFVKQLASKESNRPIFELWPPQSKALLEGGLLDPAKRAVVIEMPTSGGKTLLAEFRILQTKQLFPNSWVAYIVPTRSLVNQITNKLRSDLSPLGLKIESAVPAFELDPLEEELLTNKDAFDVLVTTQEKLDLLIRSGKLNSEGKPLGLVIVDEAHNIGIGERGLRIELILAIINREFQNVQFLLLSPFVPNIEDLATWLDSERSAKISIKWKPNEQMVGMVYPEGYGKDWNLNLKTLYTSQPTIKIKDNISFEKSNLVQKTKSSLSKTDISSVMGSILSVRSGVIIIVQKKNHVTDIANKIYNLLPENDALPPEVDLIKRYISTEFGEDFILHSLIDKGVAFHHAGVSNELRSLLEWLMRKEKLRILVSTTTLAQGVNFPISSVVMNDYKTGRPPQPMSTERFWNIAGRAGRADQETLGIVAFTSKNKKNNNIESYVKEKVSDLMSFLEDIVKKALESGTELNFSQLVRYNPEWSNFIQYLCHSYRQIGNHSKFVSQTEKLIKATYGYQRLEKENPGAAQKVFNATVDYAAEIQKIDPQVLYLVDQTGFSPDTIRNLRRDAKDLPLKIGDWSASGLFSTTNKYLNDIIGSLVLVPELKYKTGKGGKSDHFGEILKQWVNGEPISRIARSDIFMGEDQDVTNAFTKCNEALTNLVNYSSWGIGALESLSLRKEDVEKLDVRSQLELRSVPAMIYFGVNTLEGVVMRNLGVPRSIANSLGTIYKDETKNTVPKIHDARTWLKNTDVQIWDRCAPKYSKLTGDEYHKIWQIINGNY